MTDLIDRLREAQRCYLCNCISCDREGAGENHDHVCTNGEHCIYAVSKLKQERKKLQLLCHDAERHISTLRDMIEK